MASTLHKVVIVQKFGIDAGHRLVDHEGKCKNVHGHRYDFHVHLHSWELDKLGRIIDFGEVKRKLGGWLEANWDHGMLLCESDLICNFYRISPQMLYIKDKDGNLFEFPNPFVGMKFFVLPCNPTAENLSSYFLTVCKELMKDSGVTVIQVDCHETPNCSARASIG